MMKRDRFDNHHLSDALRDHDETTR